ncbi:WD40-repeat-containing domain protein [Pavlovales sp. CCMP2436]|nr:WD40-repeat-containing domain protein [Pavlovales sp. CCMP2436]
MASQGTPLEAIWGKATCISHDGKPIFSIDVHPTSGCFATAGSDGLVKMWALERVLADEPEAACLLALLEAHTGPVNCVRFSPTEDPLLASGSDDHSVVLWRRARNGVQSAPSFGSAPRPADREPWRVVAILRGHTGDVADLAWAPSSSLFASEGRGGTPPAHVSFTLATASLDGTVRERWLFLRDMARIIPNLKSCHAYTLHPGEYSPAATMPASHFKIQVEAERIRIWLQL